MFDEANLSLGELKELPEKDGTKAFRQAILYQNAKLTFLTNEFTSDNGRLVLNYNDFNRLSCLVPIAPWFRERLNTLENFITKNMTVPLELLATCGDPASVYRPLWNGNNMYITVSSWCRFLKNKANNPCAYEQVKGPDGFLCGTYQVIVEAAYVYYGNHIDAQKVCSLSLSVIEIRYKEDLNANKTICLTEFIGEEGERKSPPTNLTNTPNTKKGNSDNKVSRKKRQLLR